MNSNDIALNDAKQKKGLLRETADAVASGIEKLGIKKELVPGSTDHQAMVEQMQSGGEVLAEWNSTDYLYDELFNRNTTYRNFYEGHDLEQGVSSLEGNIKVTVNFGAAFIDLFTYLLTNNPPEVQFVGDPDPLSQAEASFKESMTARLLADAQWPKRFKDGGKTCFMLGYTYLYPFWNSENKSGGEKGTFDLSVLNPFVTRVKYRTNDIEKPESFICYERMSLAEVLSQYNYEAFADAEDISLPKSIQTETDNMVTVFHRYGPDDIRTVVNGREVERITTSLGFCPLVPVNNISMLNDIHGSSEIKRWMSLAQEINALVSAVSEVARDLAYPPIIEYNNALAGANPSKWRGMKIPAKRSDRGEAVEYLSNPAQLAPMLQQVKLLISLLHFISLMPEAAGGVFPANVTSGFQARLSMQPATLAVDSRKVDWEWAVRQIVKMAFMILKKYDSSALKIETDSNTVEISPISDHEMKVVWPQNLPVDISREIQNLVLGIQTGMTSLHQAIDKYNMLEGMGTSDDTINYLKQEVDDPALSPDRALKVQEVRAKIKDILQGLTDMQAQLAAARANMGGGLPENVPPGTPAAPNTNNLALQGKTPAEQKPYPPTGREAVVPESTGGQVIPPVGGQ